MFVGIKPDFIKDLPVRLRYFITGSHNINPELDLIALEEKPSLLLRFYLHCIDKKLPGSSEDLVDQCNAAILGSMRKKLVDQYEAQKLSEYHYVKLLLKSPDLLEKNKDKVSQLAQSFFEQIKKGSHDETMLRRAGKIALSLRAYDSFDDLRKPLDITITSTDKKEYTFNRLSWAAKIPAWRSWLIGLGSQQKNNPVGLSKRFLEVIDQFVKESTLPDSLTMEELLELYQKAEELLYDDLKKDCIEKIRKWISPETVYVVLKTGIERQDEMLIKCCNWFNTNVQFSWKSSSGLCVTLYDIGPNTKILLNALSSDIQEVYFERKGKAGSIAALKVAHQGIQFPEVKAIYLYNGESESCLAKFPPLFPKARKLNIDKDTYAGLSETFTWPGIEILRISGGRYRSETFDKQTLLELLNKPVLFQFPNLKLFLLSCGDDSEITIKSRYNALGVPSATFKEMDLQPYANMITDEILIEIIEHTNVVEKLVLSGCSKITNRAVLAICSRYEHLPIFFDGRPTGLQELHLQGCNISSDTIEKVKKSLPHCKVISGSLKRPADTPLEDLRDSKKSKEEV
ncbi:MAG: hypothetical protein K940chlam6_00336 [Chlamydiae bacterium]|nr:hypothetical protein [Chlamydiota bacterium]